MRSFIRTGSKYRRVMVLLICFFISLTGFARINGQVVLKSSTMSLKELFREIENSSNYTFFYKSENADFSKPVALNRTKGSVNEILKEALKGLPLTYQIVGTDIVIKPMVVEQTNKKHTIKGKVVDENNQPVPGANVWLKETSIGVATGIDGDYTLTFEGNYQVLVVSFIGYKNMEEIIGNRTTVDFKLVPETENLEEVVVVGYGTQKKESVIGSISTITSEKLKIPTGKLSNGLAGQMAGIVSYQRSGEPGSASEFFIRGIGTYNTENQTPLVLVDGVERSLDYVDAEDIESFSILKDATATAIYGVRGANGVILITTRKGEEGKPRISVKAEAGITAPTRMPKMANAVQFASLYNEAYGYDNNGRVYYDDATIRKYRDGSDPDLYPNVDWLGELYKDFASNQRVSMNIGGGGAIARYYISGSFYHEGSMYEEDNMKNYDSSISYKKFNFRSNLDVNVTKSTVLNVNLANIYEVKNTPGRVNNLWYYSFATSPNAFPKRYSDGTLSAAMGDSGENPYNLLTQSGYNQYFYNTAQALIGVTQDFSDLVTEGLTANVKFSWDASNTTGQYRQGTPQTYAASGRDAEGNLMFNEVNTGSESLTYSNGHSGNRVFYLEASMTYNRLFAEKHRVGALFLYNQRERHVLNPSTDYDNTTRSELALPYRNQGIAGRVTYGYDDRYFFEANFGYNGSENFSPGKRFGFFPSVAAGWMVSNEKFFQPITHIIDVLKLKGSYGIVGNDNISSSRRFVYNATVGQTNNTYYFGENNTGYTGVYLNEIANPDVSWEEAKKLNLGLELSMFNAAKLQVDYFYEKRTGIFSQRQTIPNYAGIITMPYVNVGEMNNKGIDASFDLNKKFNEVRIAIRGNFTYNLNKLVTQDDVAYADAYRSREGKPYGQQFGLIADGLFTSQAEIDNSPQQTFGTVRPGDIKYKDVNGDGVVDEKDEVAIGHSNVPQISYGFGASAQWKGFDLSFLFSGVGKVSFFMSGDAVWAFNTGNIYRSSFYEDVYNNHWSEANPDPNAKYPRVSRATNTNNTKTSSHWQVNGRYLRLKNAEIGYTFPKRWTERMWMSSARLYLSGVNLLTFSKFKLWDPEMGGGQGAAYPPQKVFNVGLNINF